MAQFPNTTAADGIWTLKKVRRAILGDNWPEVFVPDQFFSNTVLLLQADDFADGSQNNTFLDSSTNTHTITRNGNVTQGSFSPFSQDEGKWGNYFDGTGDYLQATGSSDFDLTGDFTIECWAWLNSTATYRPLFAVQGTDGFSGLRVMNLNTDEIEVILISGNTSLHGSLTSTSSPISLNTWHHIAVVRSGSTITAYVNGVSVGSFSSSSWTGSALPVTIGTGRNYATGAFVAYWDGYISNFRIVKGTAVYTSNFTPSTTPLTDITNTSLLTCQSNRFVDNSSNAHSITVNGDPEVTPFSPFAPSTAYDPATKGGSGYFDGASSVVPAADADFTFGTGDFTVEGWVYISGAASTAEGLFQQAATFPQASTSNTVAVGTVNSSKVWQMYAKNTNTNSTATWSENRWYHFAAVRNSSTTSLYIDGTSVITVASDTTNYTGTAFGIGQIYSGIGYFNGYIANVRVVKGTAVYTSNFTPPTAPVSEVSGTSFLCNFTNAGIYDGTGRNVLETVGNAQVDTAVAKYGTGSMQFDGTGDYLQVSGDSILELGTGDFTIEFWINNTAFDGGSNINTVLDYRNGATTALQPVIYFSSGEIRYFVNGDQITGSTLNTGQWYHVALCRESSVTKLFLDGSQQGSNYSDTNDYTSSVVRIGADFDTLLNNEINGYIDDFRITKGVARYTANFTPPAAKLEQQ